MDKRYQVFVSSTYRDLQEERQEVMQALLELDCIPSGMELFPAADADQWTLIKRVIDDCDYYLVIIGGRYGSTGPDGISYTEMEYRYALDTGKPIIAFLHKEPGQLAANRSEEDASGREKLKAFRELAQQKAVKYWTSPADLGSAVSRSLVWLIKNNPAVGWVRADQVPDESLTQEALQLRKQVEELERQLRASRSERPEGTDELAQGDDEFTVQYSFKAWDPTSYEPDAYSASVDLSWNNLFSEVAPLMIDEASDLQLQRCLSKYIGECQRDELSKQKGLKGRMLDQFEISESDFQTIKIQLRALGLMVKSNRVHSIKDTSTYWTLTPYGDNVMTFLRAIKRDDM